MRFLTVVLFVEVIAVISAAPVEDVKVIAAEAVSETENEVAAKPDVTLIGDIEVDVNRNGVMNNKRWSNGQIPYVINSTFSTAIHNKILTAMREIEHDVNAASGSPCIKFVQRTTQANYINVYPGTGCHATIGMAGTGKQSVSLGTGCEAKGIMMHELIHAIGFWHEQSRYDRDTYVNIDLTNVGEDEKHDFKLLTSSSSTTLNVAYDFGSIMHYGPYEFSEDKAIPVITPKAGYGHGVKMGQRLALSKSDVIKIQRLYQCTEDTSHIITPLTSGNVMEDCSFENNICTLQSDKTADFEWVRKSGASSAGPKVGNTNGADPYLVAAASGHHGVARVVTPSFNKGAVCIDFYLYQPGSSYLTLTVSGPHIARHTFWTYHGYTYKNWKHSRVDLSVDAGADFQVSFEAHIATGDVAIDDVRIFHGQCL